MRKARRGRQLCLLDIAVPRDVDPEAGKLDGIYLFDIDDLQKQASDHRAEREEEAAEAEALVEEELGRFVKRWRSRQRGPMVSALQTHFHGIAKAEVMRLSGGVDDKERKARLDLAESLVKKLLHLPHDRAARRRSRRRRFAGAGAAAIVRAVAGGGGARRRRRARARPNAASTRRPPDLERVRRSDRDRDAR